MNEKGENEQTRGSLGQALSQYYSSKMRDAYRRYDSQKTNWQGSGMSLKGWLNRLSGGLDLPYKSIALFVGCWMVLEIGWPLLIVLGVATAGTVWNIPTAIPCMFIVVYGMVLTSGVNLVRSLIVQLGDRRDNIVKALFRGYFWSLLSIGLIIMVHTYFRTNSVLMFAIPILYLIPIQVVGTTVPIPIPLGITGMYMDLIVTVIVYTVGVTGSCIGGIEIIRYLLNNSRKHGSYGAIFAVLMLAVYPAMNIYFSLIFLNSTLELFGRLLSIAI
ncbi:MAG: hypothetical protein RTU92_11425 [Candidatus Thorarchaeota archaeon]